MSKKSYDELRKQIEKHEAETKRLKQEIKQREKAEHELLTRRIGQDCLTAFEDCNLDEMSDEEVITFLSTLNKIFTKWQNEKAQKEVAQTSVQSSGGPRGSEALPSQA